MVDAMSILCPQNTVEDKLYCVHVLCKFFKT